MTSPSWLRRHLAVFFVLVMCVSASAASAQTLTGIGSPFPIITEPTQWVSRHDVSHSTVDNVYLMVWTTWSNNGVFGAFHNAAGTRILGPFVIAGAGTKDARVTYGAGDNAFLITWTEIGTKLKRARFVKYNGADPPIQTGVVTIDSLSWTIDIFSNSAYIPGTGKWMVSWWDIPAPGQSFVRWIKYDLTMGPTVQVTSGPDNNEAPEVACSPTGTCLVVSKRYNDVTLNKGIVGRWVDSNGTPQGGMFNIVAEVNKLFDDPRVGYSPVSNTFTVQWVKSATYPWIAAVTPLSLATPTPVQSTNGRPGGQSRMAYNAGSDTYLASFGSFTESIFVHQYTGAGATTANELDFAGIQTTNPGTNTAANANDVQFLASGIDSLTTVVAMRYQANANSRRLTVTITGPGAVSATGIACGNDCVEDYANNTVVALTPTPTAGAVFAGWLGHADCADGTVTMSQDLTCTARFLGAATVSDFTGDGAADLSVYRKGMWHTRNGSSSSWGVASDIPVMADYNGDFRADRAVFRPMGGTWYIQNQATVPWGTIGDIPVPADYDGNGTADIGVFRPSNGTWYVRNQLTVVFGVAGDVPVPGNYQGSKAAELAVYRRQSGTWYIRNASTVNWGSPSDMPVPADFSGDGYDDIAVYRPSTGYWYVKDVATVKWGLPGDQPLPMDTDGDGRAELVVFRPGDGKFYIYNLATSAASSIAWGIGTDVPLGARPSLRYHAGGDFDGDDRVDLAVFRPSDGTFIAKLSTTEYDAGAAPNMPFGANGDIPVPGNFGGGPYTIPGVYRPSDGKFYLSWVATVDVGGGPNDKPFAGDVDGDGASDVILWSAGSGTWTVRTSMNSFTAGWTLNHGQNGDQPAVGDFDGDGRADLAVFRESNGTWYVRRSSSNFTATTTQVWGTTGDTPVAADYDGDGRTDYAVVRLDGTDLVWYARLSSVLSPTTATNYFGFDGMIPVPGDFNGDRKADLAVWDPVTGNWYVAWLLAEPWGLTGDIPVIGKF